MPLYFDLFKGDALNIFLNSSSVMLCHSSVELAAPGHWLLQRSVPQVGCRILEMEVDRRAYQHPQKTWIRRFRALLFVVIYCECQRQHQSSPTETVQHPLAVVVAASLDCGSSWSGTQHGLWNLDLEGESVAEVWIETMSPFLGSTSRRPLRCVISLEFSPPPENWSWLPWLPWEWIQGLDHLL